MTTKEKNAQVARLIAEVPFWAPEYFPKYFTDDFTMIFPFAPPGMPNYFDEWEAECCFEWMNRTVKRWTMTNEEFYPTPDENQFWAVGSCEGDVFWGDQDGHYESKYVMRIEMRDGKIRFIKGVIEPIRMLKAAGLDVPNFHKGIEHPAVDAYLEAHPEAKTKKEAKVYKDPSESDEEVDMSPEAVRERLENNLNESACGVRREEYRKLTTANPAFRGAAWFVPDDRPWRIPPEPAMINNNREPPEDVQVRVHGWIKASSPWMYRDTRNKIFPTDDPSVYFMEMHSKGPASWYGNNCEHGHYHQPYIMIFKFDEAGRMLYRAEILNPVYKYAGANVTLPAFPYCL